MTRRSSTARLQDDVYREMLRLEAGCCGADLQLALALLRAWIELEHDPPRSRGREWLRAACPVCLRMMAANAGTCAGEIRGSRIGKGQRG